MPETNRFWTFSVPRCANHAKCIQGFFTTNKRNGLDVAVAQNVYSDIYMAPRKNFFSRSAIAALLMVPLGAALVATPTRDAEGCSGGPPTGWSIYYNTVPAYLELDEMVLLLAGITYQTDTTTACERLSAEVKDADGMIVPGALTLEFQGTPYTNDPDYMDWRLRWTPDIVLAPGTYTVDLFDTEGTVSQGNKEFVVKDPVAQVPVADFVVGSAFIKAVPKSVATWSCEGAGGCDYSHLDFPASEGYRPAIELRMGDDPTVDTSYEIIVEPLGLDGAPSGVQGLWTAELPYSWHYQQIFETVNTEYCVQLTARTMVGGHLGAPITLCVDHEDCAPLESKRENSLQDCGLPPDDPATLAAWCGYHEHEKCATIQVVDPPAACLGNLEPGTGGNSGASGQSGSSGSAGAGANSGSAGTGGSATGATGGSGGQATGATGGGGSGNAASANAAGTSNATPPPDDDAGGCQLSVGQAQSNGALATITSLALALAAVVSRRKKSN